MTGSAAVLAPHPDRLLPTDPSARTIARRLYEHVRALPILSPHGHVDPRLFVENAPFPDPSTLLVSSDHYVTRLLHADGFSLDELGVRQGRLSEERSRSVWRALCSRWDVLRGTPSRYWLESELAEIFGVTRRPSAHTADAIYDRIASCLEEDAFRPRALFESFGVEVLATTDDPVDNLDAHRSLRADPAWNGRVIPTFRPDRYLEPGVAGWVEAVDRLGEVTGIDTGDYPGYVRALEERRHHFVRNGATSADHSHVDVRTDPLSEEEAGRVYRRAREGTATQREATAFRRHMLLEMARMSTEDGLVMTLHPGVLRNHHTPTFESFGGDTGHDIPVRAEFTEALRPLLERFGTHPNLHLVLFTLDETTFSREIAPLAGFYPSVYAGAPWWFLDAPEAVRRFRGAVTETAGFTRTSGFIDDTRALCSIPARHDMSRRLDSGYLAGLVAEHRLDEDEAAAVAVDLCTTTPRKVFRL